MSHNEKGGGGVEAIDTSGDVYMCIDLKSFFASVECVERGLDPMSTNLVVADAERGEGTICLAVTPAMKALGVKNRCRVFEIPKNIRYIKAEPRMQKYIDYSTEIYGIYLDFVSPDDIHVYSIDEVFIYVSPYLKLYSMTAREFAETVMKKIYQKTGIRATCGIGTNMYLCKIALDIVAKHAPDFIGELDEERYRRVLWDHTPLTDFWRIGRGSAARLSKYGICTMRGITKTDPELLYSWFGIDAELLIDHAWGRESARMEDIKNYKSKSHSRSSGQVLMRDYKRDEARIICAEMTEALTQEIFSESLVCGSVSLYIMYADSTGDGVSMRLPRPTSSERDLVSAMLSLYDRTVMPSAIRKINITFGNVTSSDGVQCSFFDEEEETERAVQSAVIDIKRKYGKNAILKGISYTEGATARERNMQIGGHKSGAKRTGPDVKA